jgi:OFA family oxalate/formate antiporter-like MFS transporter
MNLGKILQTSDIWVLWMMLFMNVFAGLYVITNVGTILNTLTQAPLATIAAVYSFIAIANGFGRVIFGGLSDVMGRRKVFFLIYGLQFAGYMILDTPVASNFWIGIALITLILLCYGGGFGTLPGYVADAVGIRNFAPAYGAVLTAWGVAGIVAPLFAVYSRELHINVNAMLMPIDTMMGISMVLPILVYLRVGKEKGQSLIDSSIPVVASERMSSIPHVDAPPLQPQSAPVQKQPQPTYRPAPPPEPKHPAKPRPIAPARTTAR